MFTKEDYLDYFDECDKIELSMKDYYADLAKKVTDSEVKEVFLRISREEAQHSNLVESLRDYLK
jgi:rubrerythrin